MDNNNIEIKCPNCKKKVFVNYNTDHCPRCNVPYDNDNIKDMFHKLESINRNTQRAKNIGNGVRETGDAMNNIGCALMLIPFAIIGLIILFSLL